MNRRILALAVTAGLLGLAIPLSLAAPASAADVKVACTGTASGTTFTLTADCAVTEPLTVPDGFTLDGGGHTISATDAGGPQWNGAIITNAGTSMNILNVTVSGPAGGFQLCTQSSNVLYGIFFNDASGSVSNVVVDHIYQFQNAAFGACQTGRAIRADAITAARTVTISATTVRDYQKSGFEARGAQMTMSITGSVAGPPHPLVGLIAQNGVAYVGATGTIENNTIYGSGDQAAGVGGPANGTAVLLFGAKNVLVTKNKLIGSGTDIGISVSAGSTGNTLSFNSVTRTVPPGYPDPTGVGIDVDSSAEALSSAALTCNTFGGWKQNVVGAIQLDCTPLPAGSECGTYTTPVPGVEGGTAPFTWTLESGALPAGLTLAPDGTIAGTPATGSAGAHAFVLRATDAAQLTATTPQTITISPGCAPSPTPTPPATPAASTGPELAPTGQRTPGLPMTLVGLILLAAGAALTALSRRGR